MFERPLFLLLLLLLLPWWRWNRRRRPRPWVVGGLEPFRELGGGAGQRLRTPLSAWLGAAAILLAAGALAGPRFWSPAPLGVVDASLSCAGRLPPGQNPASLLPAAAREHAVVLGADGGLVQEEEILACIRQHAGGRRVAVVTDRPEPLGLPGSIRWIRPPPVETAATAAILAVWPTGGELAVHWVSWKLGRGLRLRLERADGSKVEMPLAGDEGEARIPQEAGVRLVLVHPELAAADAAPRWRRWDVPRPPRVLLPVGAGEAWENAVQALLPGASVFRGGGEGKEPTDLRIAFAAGGGDVRFAADPFRELPAPQAMARVAAALEPWRRRWWGAARLRAECQPVETAADWRGLTLPASAGRESGRTERLLAGLGLLLYLASLLLRRVGR